MQRIIKALQTKEENYTLSIDNVFLHSKYYPLKEAEKFIENNINNIKNKEYIVIYGIGLAYHLKKLLNIVDENSKVFAFDADIEVIKKSEEVGLLNELKMDKRLEIFFEYNKNFFKALSDKMKLVEDIIVYKPSVRTLPSEYDDLINLLNSYELAKIAVKKFGNIAKENYIVNLQYSNKSIKDFFRETNFSDKPIVIASGGPSLENNLRSLRKYRDNIYIFALGRTLDILMKNEIKPDVIIIIDPQNLVFEQIKEYINLDIPLCYLSTANSMTVKNYTGPKYIFFNDLDEKNIDNIVISTGKSVAVAAIDIAVKSGPKQIIFLGQDLAYINNKFHAGDKEERESNLTPGGNRKVLGVDGNMLDTNMGLLEFKRNIEKIINLNPNVEFINCSKGAKIRGTKERELEQIL
ncbi:MAG: putative transrane anchored flag10 domain protein [Clostridiaceae bacterium]|jgi:hypothetical protein|nr:putative transrane anchored flag10 domain protein [Clostridiaceae bacterium]